MAIIRCVSVSGGKDSTACALLALERHPAEEIRLVFADTGNEHDITMEYLTEYMPRMMGLQVDIVKADFSRQIAGKAEFVRNKWAEKGVSQDKIDRALAVLVPTGIPFLDLCIWKGRFPSRKAQFCTMELKTGPLGEYQIELLDDGYQVESWQGVRRDESQARRNALEREDVGGGLTIYRPIVEWTAQQTVDYVLSRGLELNPLYSQGMGRVGCMPCINARKDEIHEIATRFPEHVERIAEWERIVAEASKRGGSTFFASPSRGKEGRTTEDAVAEGNIYAAVEWSKTARGGKHYDIFKGGEPVACSSAYGLCE